MNEGAYTGDSFAPSNTHLLNAMTDCIDTVESPLDKEKRE